MRKKYPSDISPAQFETIRPLLENARKRTKPRVIDLYHVFCGILYVLKSGECFQVIFQNGVLYIGISKFGVLHEIPSQVYSKKL